MIEVFLRTSVQIRRFLRLANHRCLSVQAGCSEFIAECMPEEGLEEFHVISVAYVWNNCLSQ